MNGGAVLSGIALKRAIRDGELSVSPVLEWGSDNAADGQFGRGSIDIRLSTYFAIPRATAFSVIDASGRLGASGEHERFDTVVRTAYGRPFVLHPGQFALAYTLEYFTVPNHLMGYVIGRSSWGRLGLIIATATMINPGFRGVITLELANVGNLPIVLYPCMRIAQLVVHRLQRDLLPLAPERATPTIDPHQFESGDSRSVVRRAPATAAESDLLPAPDDKYTDQLPGNTARLFKDREIAWVVPRSATELIGIVGPTKSGKSLLTTYFMERGFRRYSLATEVLAIAGRRGITRADTRVLQDLGDRVRKESDRPYYFAERISDLIRQDKSEPRRIVITGFKNPAEVRYFQRDSRFRLIALSATRERCAELYHAEQELSASQVDDFVRIWNRDYDSGDRVFGQYVKGCIELAGQENTLLNDSSKISGLLDKLDSLVMSWEIGSLDAPA
jgi:dCTP deaminase